MDVNENAGIQISRVVVGAHRERARSYGVSHPLKKPYIMCAFSDPESKEP